MESLRRFCRNSVPVYFTKIKTINANKQDDLEDEKLFLHSDYLSNVLAREQVTKFYNAAYNLEYLFKNGAFRIKLASEAWRVKDTCCKVMNDGVTTPRSKMGIKLVEITSILENLLQRDQFLFYTAGDRKLISQLLLPLSQSMGKLERKISRLCQQVDEHRKVISELASRYEDCEDDDSFFMEADESDTESFMENEVVLSKRQPHKLNKKLLRFWFFLTCASNISEDGSRISSTHPHDRFHRRIQSRRLSCKDELIGFPTTHTSQDYILSNVPYSKASECSSTIDSLCPPMDTSTENFIISALTPPISNAGTFELQRGSMDEWRKTSYEQVLQDVLQQSPDNIDTFDDFYSDFHENSRALTVIQKKIDYALSTDYSQASFDLKYEKHVSIKSQKELEDGNQNASSFADGKYEMGSTCYSLENNENNCNDDESGVEICDQRMEYSVADTVFSISGNDNEKIEENITTAYDEPSCKSEKCKNKDYTEDIKTKSEEFLGRFPLDPMTCYEYNVSDMLSYINDLTNCLRSLECSWLEPYRDEKIKGNPKNNKELAEIVDYLVFTINLLDDPLFTRQIYLEDKESVIRALKPVADAVTSCSNAFVELTRLTLKDAQYLQKVIDHFPMHDTDIVIYDHDTTML